MSASSSLSRLEFVLNAADPAHPATTTPTTQGNSFSNIIPSWMGGNVSAKSLPAAGSGGGAPTTGSSSLSASASAASASATAAAQRVSHSANEWFNKLSAKVQGKEHVPSAAPVVDLESGAGGGDASGRSLLSSDPGGATSGIAAQFSSELNALTTLSWRNRMIAFAMCLTAGLVLLFLAFSFLPLVFVGSPAKFASSYALASMFLIGSSCFLVGPSKQLSQMFQADRALPSSIYLSSLLLTFYVAWQYRSFFIVVPVLAVQFASLAWYVMSYVPFGQATLKRIFSWTVGRQWSLLS